jgi:hypothetical protein
LEKLEEERGVYSYHLGILLFSKESYEEYDYELLEKFEAFQ